MKRKKEEGRRREDKKEKEDKEMRSKKRRKMTRVFRGFEKEEKCSRKKITVKKEIRKHDE
jgi:hypothetical protein